MEGRELVWKRRRRSSCTGTTPNSRVAETVTAPYTDEEAEYMLLGTPDSWGFLAEYARLRSKVMGIEQAMSFVGHRFRMWHLRYEKVG